MAQLDSPSFSFFCTAAVRETATRTLNVLEISNVFSVLVRKLFRAAKEPVTLGLTTATMTVRLLRPISFPTLATMEVLPRPFRLAIVR
jgi:hypothetical protein